jgi:hypothetical protein
MHDLGDFQNLGNIALTFDPTTSHFTAKLSNNPVKYPGQNRPEMMDNPNTLNRVNGTLQRLNSGIDNLTAVAKAGGEKDIPGYILKSLQQQSVPLEKINGLSREFMQKLNYTDVSELMPGDLKAFLANPGGSSQNNAPKASAVAPRGIPEDVSNIQTYGAPIDIPEGMSARDFIAKLRKEGKI